MEVTKWDFLLGAGIVVVFISATVILKKFFDITTSEALLCIIIGSGILSLMVLLVIEYVDYKARKKQSGIEARKVP